MGYPAWRYRLNDNGEVESQIFDSEPQGKGWFDTPAKLVIEDDTASKAVDSKPKRGRPRNNG